MVGRLPALPQLTCHPAWVTQTASSLYSTRGSRRGTAPWEVARGLCIGLGISFHPLPRDSLTGGGRKAAGAGRAVTNGTGGSVEFSLAITSPGSWQAAPSKSLDNRFQMSGPWVSKVLVSPKLGYGSKLPSYQAAFIPAPTFTTPQDQPSSPSVSKLVQRALSKDTGPEGFKESLFFFRCIYLLCI